MKKYNEYKKTNIPFIPLVPKSWGLHRGKFFEKSKKIINKNNERDNVLSLTLKGVINNNKDRPIGLSPKDYNTYQFFNKDDLVFKLIDLNNIKTSRVGLVHEDGIMSSAYIRVSFNKKYFNVKYLYYYYYKLYIEEVYNKIGSGVRETLTKKNLLDLFIPKPSLEEQDKIADFLDWKINEIDKLIVLEKKEILNLKDLKKSITKKYIFGEYSKLNKINQNKIAWINKIPSEWKLERLKNLIISNVSGAWGDEEKKDEFDTICLRIADFDYENGLFKNTAESNLTKRNYKESVIEKLMLRQGDILVEKSGGGEKTPVGRTVLFDKKYKALYANFMTRLRVKKDIIVPEFLQYYFKVLYFSKRNTIYIKQTTGIQNLNITSLLENELIFLPSISEQKEIVNILNENLSEIDKLIVNKKIKIEELEKLKQSLISEVVTGQIDVRDIKIPEVNKNDLVEEDDIVKLSDESIEKEEN